MERSSKQTSARKALMTGILLLVSGLLMAVAGFSLGGSQSVLQKAIRICLECVGIG